MFVHWVFLKIAGYPQIESLVGKMMIIRQMFGVRIFGETHIIIHSSSQLIAITSHPNLYLINHF